MNMTLNLTSIQRADGKTYKAHLMPAAGGTALYEIVEAEPGRSDRVICQLVLHGDAVLITEALNNYGSKS